MTTDSIVRLAEAAHARYGFDDFKLKGGFFTASRRWKPSAVAKQFPHARMTLDPNGAWSLAEAISGCAGTSMKFSLTLKTRAARKTVFRA